MFFALDSICRLPRLEGMEIDWFERDRRTLGMITAGILQVALVLGVGAVALYDVFMLLIVNAVLQGLGWIYDQEDMPERLRGYVLAAIHSIIVEIQNVIFQTTNLEGIEVGPYIVMGVPTIFIYCLDL